MVWWGDGGRPRDFASGRGSSAALFLSPRDASLRKGRKGGILGGGAQFFGASIIVSFNITLKPICASKNGKRIQESTDDSSRRPSSSTISSRTELATLVGVAVGLGWPLGRRLQLQDL